MKSLRRFFEYGYLIIGIVMLADGIYRFNKAAERQTAYLLIGFSIVAFFMYFFKRHYRKKIEARNNNENR